MPIYAKCLTHTRREINLESIKTQTPHNLLCPSIVSMLVRKDSSHIRSQGKRRRAYFPGSWMELGLCAAICRLMLSLAALTSPGADCRDIGLQSLFLCRVRLGRQLDQRV
jgi:hypothetical protein